MGNLWSCLKEVKPLLVIDGQHRMTLEQMQGNQASSRLDMGYLEQLLLAAVTSRSL